LILRGAGVKILAGSVFHRRPSITSNSCAMSSVRYVFHLLPNAHLDPVWLWDWREGLNEGRITIATILDLMDEFPDLTFIRGESSIYEHVQKADPKLFRRIREKMDEGRWDVVGGTVVQPDTNMAATETLCREFERGLSYFKKELGVRPTVAWQADSFGHSPGLPNILSAFGFEGFAFTRPQRAQFPMDAPAFWWEGAGNARILCYRQHWRWYCTERAGIREVLDETRQQCEAMAHVHVGVLFGLGNHGGGPTRRHLREIEEWRAAHPEVEVRFDTLHGFFSELKTEVESRSVDIPAVRGELGYCLRGCYSSVQRFKSLYRRAEPLIAESETCRSLVAELTGSSIQGLDEAWDALVFNAFHDILPGSSIERAMEEQEEWMGMALHLARKTRFEALNRLTQEVDTTVPPARLEDGPTDVPLLLWNPLPRPVDVPVEMEAALDYRPLWQFQHKVDDLQPALFSPDGTRIPCQRIATEHTSMQDVPWRVRVVTPVALPPLGWTVLRLGWREQAVSFDGPCTAKDGPDASVSDGEWTVRIAGNAVEVLRNGKPFFREGGFPSLRVYEDPWGAWGGMNEERDSYVLDQERERWKLEEHQVIERGPLRSKLWTRWRGENSWIDLTFSVAGLSWIAVEGRLLWNERSARLMMALPCVGSLRFDMPGTVSDRDAEGNVPGGRWVTRSDGDTAIGFASDVLGDFAAVPDELRVTLARATRFGDDVNTPANEKRWIPATDGGTLKFRFCLFGGDANPDQVADSLLHPPVVATVRPSAGIRERTGSLAELSPWDARLLSLEQMAPGALRIRVHHRGPKRSQVQFRIGESQCALGELDPQQIATFDLIKGGGGWTVQAAY
jgi:alpha-mannosidase